jgi:hypothetical protein
LLTGNYSFASSAVINKHNIKVSGMGKMTVLHATGNFPVFKVSNTPSNPDLSIWHTEICDFKMIDYGNVVTSAGFIYLNNEAGGLHFQYIHDIYFENSSKQIYTDSLLTSYTYKKLYYFKVINCHFENPRGNAIFINNSIDERLEDLTITLNDACSSYVVLRTNPDITSVGAFWDRITILRQNPAAVTNGMIYIFNCNELTANNVIIDVKYTGGAAASGYGLYLHHASQNRFANWLVWQTSTHGVYLYKGCEHNLFSGLTSSGHAGYGVNDLSELTNANAFYDFYGASNSLGNLNLTSYDKYSNAFS